MNYDELEKRAMAELRIRLEHVQDSIRRSHMTPTGRTPSEPELGSSRALFVVSHAGYLAEDLARGLRAIGEAGGISIDIEAYGVPLDMPEEKPVRSISRGPVKNWWDKKSKKHRIPL